jgi:hypothetical protein
MTGDMDWLGALDVLGRVAPPSSDALDAAREVLWSAVAGEMLGTHLAAGRPRRAGRRRDPGSRHRDDPGS